MTQAPDKRRDIEEYDFVPSANYICAFCFRLCQTWQLHGHDDGIDTTDLTPIVLEIYVDHLDMLSTGLPLSDYIMPFFGFGKATSENIILQSSDDDQTTSTMSEKRDKDAVSLLLNLPAEIIQHTLSYLDSRQLGLVRRTCKQLKDAAEQDVLWSGILRHHVPGLNPTSPDPYPAPTYRALYLNHHPHWFLTRNKIWISDEPHVGKLMLCKFDPRRGCIEGYRLLAERGPATGLHWAYKPSVVIHNFAPRVHLWLDDPVLSLPYDHAIPEGAIRYNDGYQGDLKMTLGSGGHTTSAAFFLSKDIPQAAQFPGMSLWPPRTIPNMPRVRDESLDKFQSKGHRPSTFKEISQTTFRMRHWSQFSTGWARFGVRIGEEVSTWSTLDPKLYTPTQDKPYQGIFVGDYAGHGCEFLLVMQTDAAPPPPHRHIPSEYLTLILRAMEDDVAADIVDSSAGSSSIRNPPEPVVPNVQNANAHRGALEAIKLTGDPNVPRGEHTFIADDISDSGLIRIAEERPFRGARVVKSRGHVAARGFQNDEFIPSQLIMISPDKLAQYWVPFGHISFYQRIDIDQILAKASSFSPDQKDSDCF